MREVTWGLIVTTLLRRLKRGHQLKSELGIIAVGGSYEQVARYRLLCIQGLNVKAILGYGGFGDAQAESSETQLERGSMLMYLSARQCPRLTSYSLTSKLHDNARR